MRASRTELLDYELDEFGVRRLLTELPKWILEDKISIPKAKTLVLAIEALSKIGFKLEDFERRIKALEKIAGIPPDKMYGSDKQHIEVN